MKLPDSCSGLRQMFAACIDRWTVLRLAGLRESLAGIFKRRDCLFSEKMERDFGKKMGGKSDCNLRRRHPLYAVK